ncbi:MAG: secondary thiamine-phosphate synthase enzyme YjbQ [Caldiserica bacterium]|jgi:secondary thiamine-phosphate synthase enzyme|nr:secondary thiamine-phosphate synthase enzyme YjbQ [Caldisericota bacterium]MDH7562566.1 secondary thiamine-phosphate synthase enzyme YjbQ [Caldisericota bacterium]
MVHRDSFYINTQSGQNLVDITFQVGKVVNASKIRTGICHVNSGHSTSAIVVNEGEPSLMADFIRLLNSWVPQIGWGHGANAHAHLKSLIIGNSRTIPVLEGRLDLGTWQSIFFLEMDGPRRRQVTVTVIGD